MASIQTSKNLGLMTAEAGSADLNGLNTPMKATGSKRPSDKSMSGKGVKRTSSATSNGTLDNEEDNSADEADEEDDDPNEDAPSGGFGMGRGKRPAIHVEPADTEKSEDRGTGLNQEGLLTPLGKKRTFSNTGIFGAFEEDATNGHGEEPATAYPRKKMDRKLSNNANGLLAYEGIRKDSTASDDAPPVVPENAIDSSDDDDDIYKAVEDIDESDNDEYIDENLEEKALREALSTSDNDSDFGDGPDVSMLLDSGYLEGNLLDMDNDQLLGLSGENWGGMEEITPVQSNNSTRRVRFDDHVHTVSDVDDSDTSSEDLNSFFPDLFHKENHILSSFRHGHELDDVDYLDGSTASDSERSYWDFGDEKELSSNSSDREHDANMESGSDSEAGSSGYESTAHLCLLQYCHVNADNPQRTRVTLPMRTCPRHPPLTSHHVSTVTHLPQSAPPPRSPFHDPRGRLLPSPRSGKVRSRASSLLTPEELSPFWTAAASAWFSGLLVSRTEITTSGLLALLAALPTTVLAASCKT